MSDRSSYARGKLEQIGSLRVRFAECSPMLLAGEQAPLFSPRRRHNGHGRTCHWFGPVANGPKRSFCLEQTSCEQFDIASDQIPMVSVIGGGGYCCECHQKTLLCRGKKGCGCQITSVCSPLSSCCFRSFISCWRRPP